MLEQKGFDLWADGYDRSVGLSDESGTYPFAGYKNILSEIYRRVLTLPGRQILDIGFGTGTLTTKLYEAGCMVFGQDFSPRMIELAQEKMPGAKLYQGDFSQGLVEELKQQRYDAIIATYALHHLTDNEKVEFLRSLLLLLAPGGRIYIGDVAFSNRDQLEECKTTSGDEWDEDEIYFVFDELKVHFRQITFMPFSACAGLLELWNGEPEIREYTFYHEEEILSLYQAVAWRNYTDCPAMLRDAFAHSLLTLGAYDGNKLVGLIRVVGDGASIVYVQDLLVCPEYQRRGIGRRLLRAVMERYQGVYQMILSTDDTPQSVGFYRSCGFVSLSDLNCCSFMRLGRRDFPQEPQPEAMRC